MPTTYILIESNGMATMIPEKDIERVAAERMVGGQRFQIYRAEPMKLQISLAPAKGEAPMSVPLSAPKNGRRKALAAKPGSKKAGAPAATKVRRGKGSGKVGRPPVNVGPCTVPGCGRDSKTRGLCSAHYQQHRRLSREGKEALLATGASSESKTGSAPKAAKRGRGRPPKRSTEIKKGSAPKTQAQATTTS